MRVDVRTQDDGKMTFFERLEKVFPLVVVLQGEPLVVLEVGRLQQFSTYYVVRRPVAPDFVRVLPIRLTYNGGGREY